MHKNFNLINFNRGILLIIPVVIMFSSCAYKINEKFLREIEKDNYPMIIFESKCNLKIKVFVNDSLYFNDNLSHLNYDSLQSKIITFDKIPKTVEIKVGLREKVRIEWRENYAYFRVTKENWISPLEYTMFVGPNTPR